VSAGAVARRMSTEDTEFDEILQQELATNDTNEVSGLQQENHAFWEMNYHEAAIFLEVFILNFLFLQSS
jgi:hypothetical protein